MYVVLYGKTDHAKVDGKAHCGYGVHGYCYTLEPPTRGSGNSRALPTANGWQRKTKVDKTQAVKLHFYIEQGLNELALPDSKWETVKSLELGGLAESLVSFIKTLKEETFARYLEECYEERLEKAQKSKKDPEPLPEVRLEGLKVYCDSEYVVRGFHHRILRKAFKEDKWVTPDDQPIKDAESWKTLLMFEKALKDMGISLELNYLDGSDGNVGLDQASIEASKAVNDALVSKPLDNLEIVDPDGYWKTGHTIPYALATQTWYYNTKDGQPQNALWNDELFYLYHMGKLDNTGKSEGKKKLKSDTSKKDDDHGKRVNNNTFMVTALKEPEPVLEAIRQKQAEALDPRMQHICLGRLSNIFKSTTYDRLVKEGPKSLRAHPRTGYIYELTKAEVSVPLKTPLISYRSLEVLNDLQTHLGRVVTNNLYKFERLTDVTDLIFEKNPKGDFVIRKTITTTNPTVDAKVTFNVTEKDRERTIPLVLGMDLPPRNVLAKLTDNPKVQVVTWKESNVAFRVATVISTNQCHVLWVGFYSNIHRVT